MPAASQFPVRGQVDWSRPKGLGQAAPTDRDDGFDGQDGTCLAKQVRRGLRGSCFGAAKFGFGGSLGRQTPVCASCEERRTVGGLPRTEVRCRHRRHPCGGRQAHHGHDAFWTSIAQVRFRVDVFSSPSGPPARPCTAARHEGSGPDRRCGARRGIVSVAGAFASTFRSQESRSCCTSRSGSRSCLMASASDAAQASGVPRPTRHDLLQCTLVMTLQGEA